MKKSIVLFLIFNLYNSCYSIICFTSLSDTSNYSDVFIGKAIKNYSFPSFDGNWVHEKQFTTFEIYNVLKGFKNNPDTISIESFSVENIPFTIDSTYIVFSSLTCKDKWHLSHLFTKMECSLTTLRRNNPDNDEDLYKYYDYFFNVDTAYNKTLIPIIVDLYNESSENHPNYFILSILLFSVIFPIVIIWKIS